MTKETFYMLYAEHCDTPTFKHTTYESALTEAKRITVTLKVPVYILEARQRVSKVEYTITDLTKEDELPF